MLTPHEPHVGIPLATLETLLKIYRRLAISRASLDNPEAARTTSCRGLQALFKLPGKPSSPKSQAILAQFIKGSPELQAQVIKSSPEFQAAGFPAIFSLSQEFAFQKSAEPSDLQPKLYGNGYRTLGTRPSLSKLSYRTQVQN